MTIPPTRLAFVVCAALVVVCNGRAAASPGKVVCDIRSVEFVWADCHATGLVVRGACAPVDQNASDYFGAPSSGYFYFSCMGDNCRSAAERIAQAAKDLPDRCWDFYGGTFFPQSTPLSMPDSVVDYPIDWVGCERLKSYPSPMGAVSAATLDYRQTPAACDRADDAGVSADSDAGMQPEARAGAGVAAPLAAAGNMASVVTDVAAAGSHSAGRVQPTSALEAGASARAPLDAGPKLAEQPTVGGAGGCSVSRQTATHWHHALFAMVLAAGRLRLRRRLSTMRRV